MQAIMETIFDILYLGTVITLGILMYKKSKGNSLYRLFGIMAIVLGCGDAFHLIPRAFALLTMGLEANAAALGVGKFVTSITMTIFYVILYHIWRTRYEIRDGKALTYGVYILAAARIGLCFFPQNEWLLHNSSAAWGVYRNIPFVILGVIIIYLFAREIKIHNDRAFRFMPLAIIISFGFYIPVVLWANTTPLIGMLMIPKTLAYVWVVYMGFSDLKKRANVRK